MHMRRCVVAILGLLAMLLPSSAGLADDGFDPQAQASRHAIELNRPAVNFFEGGLLGNGGMGAVVRTRPDSVLVHFGHNDVWDIRVAEENRDKLLPFDKLWPRIKSNKPEDKAWFEDYRKMTQQNYRQTYPRPWPCGTLLLGFDRREAELIGHKVRIDTGVCEVYLLANGRRLTVEIFPDMQADRLWVRTLDAERRPVAGPFNRVQLLPEDGMPTIEARLDDTLSFRQALPHLSDIRAKDKALRTSMRLSTKIKEAAIESGGPFVACVQIQHGMAADISGNVPVLPEPTVANYEAVQTSTGQAWKSFWSKSGVRLSDQALEQTWYRNTYFLNCAARPGAKCPGLFANWSYKNIGTAWHGDYHTNYNIQQPFWGTFSSNHTDNHLPYVDMVDFLLPISRDWARTHYKLPGAFFPHSAYPVEMTMMPYPVPTWGAEVCETPWVVQSLWWHYLYAMDKDFLRKRAFGPIRESVQFLNAYMRRPEARGKTLGGTGPFDDDKYHIYPTVVPELFGISSNPKLNADCIVDLTLTKFVFKAYLEACRILGTKADEAELARQVREILDRFPENPTTVCSYGRVFLSVSGEKPEQVCNCPNHLTPVFPGEEIGLHSPAEQLQIAINTWRNHQNEGGNELVFLNLQGARLGVLDLEKFKRQINYCLLPNGSCADMVLQTGGRYKDTTDYEFMAAMGVWVENFALPVVINECMLQSYTGELRFFANWPADKAGEFQDLRAVGAFLVSASYAKGRTQWIRIKSEAGGTLRIINPWSGQVEVTRGEAKAVVSGALLKLDTKPGEVIVLRPRS